MKKVEIHGGVCGFRTLVEARCDDGQTVTVSLESGCPNVKKCAGDLLSVDSYQEIFSKFHETVTYRTLSPHLPHVACPVYTGVLKAIEAAAGLALPRDASIRFVEGSESP